MSIVFCSTGINLITYGHQYGLQASGVNLQMLRDPTVLLRPKFAYRQHISKSPASISAATCHKKSYRFFRDAIVSKAMKTDDHEVSSSFTEEDSAVDFDWGEEDDEGSPWEGAIVYRRNPSISHVEYCSTLEGLGLAKLSSEVSRSAASAMGLRVTKAVKDYLQGTPVLVSVDVTRKKQKLRLDGIIRTVISLPCNRCGEQAAESVFSNFSLLLTEEPIEEPDVINMGVMFGEEVTKGSAGTTDEEEDEDETSIDFEDRFYFPPEEKEIDISKHIRDMVHLEITINAVCDPTCKGLCLNCGTNLNASVCKCSKEKESDVAYGPLGELRKQMQQK